MKITLSRSAGFCPGVKVAARKIEELIDKRGEDEIIVTLGNLIHNQTYVSSLSERGVRSVDVSEIEVLASKPDIKKNLRGYQNSRHHKRNRTISE